MNKLKFSVLAILSCLATVGFALGEFITYNGETAFAINSKSTGVLIEFEEPEVLDSIILSIDESSTSTLFYVWADGDDHQMYGEFQDSSIIININKQDEDANLVVNDIIRTTIEFGDNAINYLEVDQGINDYVISNTDLNASTITIDIPEDAISFKDGITCDTAEEYEALNQALTTNVDEIKLTLSYVKAN